jgi:hypothetical protein
MVVSGFCDLGTALTFLGEAHDQHGLFICGEHLANVLAKHGTFAGNFCKFKTDGFAGTSVVADASAFRRRLQGVRAKRTVEPRVEILRPQQRRHPIVIGRHPCGNFEGSAPFSLFSLCATIGTIGDGPFSAYVLAVSHQARRTFEADSSVSRTDTGDAVE